MNIRPDETEIVGSWIFNDNRMSADSAEARIEELTGSHLQKLANDSTGWEALYRDPNDGRLWELTFSHGPMQGGGPKKLWNITNEIARQKYGFQNDDLGTRIINA
jgi:hypothetical protein